MKNEITGYSLQTEICEICGKHDKDCSLNPENNKISCSSCEKFSNVSSYTKYHREYAERQKARKRWKKFSYDEKVIIRDFLKGETNNTENKEVIISAIIDQLDSEIGYVVI